MNEYEIIWFIIGIGGFAVCMLLMLIHIAIKS